MPTQSQFTAIGKIHSYLTQRRVDIQIERSTNLEGPEINYQIEGIRTYSDEIRLPFLINLWIGKCGRIRVSWAVCGGHDVTASFARIRIF